MSNTRLSTKDRLIRAAASLFRTHGYHGVALNDLLAKANAPKGSLYHHFPNGKSDLARAAAVWASDEMLRILADSFAEADTFQDGATTLCHKLAKLFDLTGHWDACPISATLFDSPDNHDFRSDAKRLYDGWIMELAHHGERLGLPRDQARAASEHVFFLIQGGWLLARTRQSTDVICDLPRFLKDYN